MRLRPNSRRNLLAAASFDYGAEKHAPPLRMLGASLSRKARASAQDAWRKPKPKSTRLREVRDITHIAPAILRALGVANGE
jgi:hypothetical protein